jgi:AraC-like DNA-binding protein
VDRPTTPALYAIKLVEVLKQQAVNCQPLLQDAGFTATELLERDREIRLDKYLHLVEAATTAASLDDLGFLVGEHTGPLEHGVLGYALLSSHNLGAALQRYSRYQGVVGPLLEITLEIEGQQAAMVAQPVASGRELPLAVSRYFLQEWLATWNHWSRLIGSPGYFFTGVSIGLPDQSLVKLYQNHLGCPIEFGGQITTASFPAANLDSPLQYSDERTGAFCHEQCELLLKAQSLEHGLTAEIHRQLAKSPGQMPAMEKVAQQLGMTSRTLRRHLQQEETTYQEIVIRHRIAMAKRYLMETSLPADEIADLVGYADPTNFYRMFRREEGLTPSRYREQRSAS